MPNDVGVIGIPSHCFDGLSGLALIHLGVIQNVQYFVITDDPAHLREGGLEHALELARPLQPDRGLGLPSGGDRFHPGVSLALTVMMQDIVSNSTRNAMLALIFNPASGIAFVRDHKSFIVEPDSIVILQSFGGSVEIFTQSCYRIEMLIFFNMSEANPECRERCLHRGQRLLWGCEPTLS